MRYFFAALLERVVVGLFAAAFAFGAAFVFAAVELARDGAAFAFVAAARDFAAEPEPVELERLLVEREELARVLAEREPALAAPERDDVARDAAPVRLVVERDPAAPVEELEREVVERVAVLFAPARDAVAFARDGAAFAFEAGFAVSLAIAVARVDIDLLPFDATFARFVAPACTFFASVALLVLAFSARDAELDDFGFAGALRAAGFFAAAMCHLQIV